MRTSSHARGEGFLVKTHANGSHFSSCEGGIEHHVAPFVHLGFPIVESLRDNLGDIFSYLLGALSNGPEEAPLGIKVGRELGERVVLRGELIEDPLMVAGTLLLLWCDSSLEVELWLAVSEFLACIEFTSVLLEVLLH